MNRRRVAILTEIIAPYRVPIFNALEAREDVEPHVIFFSESDPSLREWRVHKDEIKFSYEVLPSWRRRVGKFNLLLNRGVAEALGRANPDVVLCGGYSYLASWQAAAWASRQAKPLLLWSESTSRDFRHKYGPVEYMKKRFIWRCQASLAAGKSSRDYLQALGACGDSVFNAPDAVDVELYSRLAESARGQALEVRARYGLPSRYFLCAGRLVREKGVFDLLSAYAKLDDSIRAGIGLVFAGAGTERTELERRATRISPGTIKFTGFLQREPLAELYALAETFVFPTHSDPWGLVVNEAMACGLPIIASDAAGCVSDLVENGWNGFVVGPGNVDELAKSMRALASQHEQRSRMGLHSMQRIQAYTPALWAEGVAQAIEFTCGGNK
jgi:glycosyltransferase involved in cell wall biosynthesis